MSGSTVTLSAEDAQTLLVAARLGWAWSTEEAFRLEGENGAWRVDQLRQRSDSIRKVVRELESQLGVPEGKRMIRKTRNIHPTRSACPEDRYCAPESTSYRWQP